VPNAARNVATACTASRSSSAGPGIAPSPKCDPDAPPGEVIRVREGGEVLDRIPLDRAGFGNALGGPDGTTLFMVAADWRGPDKVDEALADRTGQVLVSEAPAPGAGWP
jgi:hypothetical protein